ncbi:hypothetical protein [Kiloniella sp. b19]|uniref:hypothetical protein n=1 Tax=Kiloniella sp. GXU_MW_B19 TaxID=3141326 RepID=UPI0031DF85FA
MLFADHIIRALIRRALIVAVIAGTALTIINQWEALTGAAAFSWWKLVLTYCVPFTVSSVSSYMTARPGQSGSQEASSRSGLIVKRALIVAVVAGTILTFINQWDALFGNANLSVTKFLLTYCVPFTVSSVSSFLTGRSEKQNQKGV